MVDSWGLRPTEQEAAMMADHIYKDIEKGVSVSGWVLVNIKTNDESLKIGVYAKTVNGVTEYCLVNRGTTHWFDKTKLFNMINSYQLSDDAKNNVAQLMGNSRDIKDSVEFAKYFVRNVNGAEVTMIGHSKGGAEAAANAIATNTDAIIFNPASLSQASRNKNGLNTDYYTGKVTAFVVLGEILNGLPGKKYDNTILLNTQYETNPYWKIDPRYAKREFDNSVDNHGMEAVMKALAERSTK